MMARLPLFDDTVAHICWNYLHGGLGAEGNEKLYYATAAIVHHKSQIHVFIMEIADRTGYANSILVEERSENTYKKKKRDVRKNILKAFGRSE